MQNGKYAYTIRKSLLVFCYVCGFGRYCGREICDYTEEAEVGTYVSARKYEGHPIKNGTFLIV